MRITLTLLGTGTPTPRLARAGSSYLVTAGNQRIMVDCGPFAMHRLLEAGVAPTEVHTLLLTHLHYDHCVDYAHLLLSRWSEGRDGISPLRVIGPPGTLRMTELLIADGGAFAADIATRPPRNSESATPTDNGSALVDVEEIYSGGRVMGTDWQLRAAEVQHYQPHLIALAYRLELDGRALVFGGDTAPVPQLTELATGATVLVHMCHYLNTDAPVDPELARFCSGHLDAARTAVSAGAEMLILVHIPPDLDNQTTQTRILEEIAAVYPGRTVFGTDLVQLEL